MLIIVTLILILTFSNCSFFTIFVCTLYEIEEKFIVLLFYFNSIKCVIYL